RWEPCTPGTWSATPPTPLVVLDHLWIPEAFSASQGTRSARIATRAESRSAHPRHPGQSAESSAYARRTGRERCPPSCDASAGDRGNRTTSKDVAAHPEESSPDHGPSPPSAWDRSALRHNEAGYSQRARRAGFRSDSP